MIEVSITRFTNADMEALEGRGYPEGSELYEWEAFEEIMLYNGYSSGCIYEIKNLIKRIYEVEL